MIEATIGLGEYSKTLYRTLSQWDYGQVLKVTGIRTWGNVEVHFSNSRDGAYRVLPDEVGNGWVTVAIPNVLLRESKEIHAFVYCETEDSGRTEYRITMTVVPRPKPEDYEAPQDRNVLAQLMDKVEGKADGGKIVDGALQLLSGGREVGERIRLPSGGGTGREVELRNNGQAVQWRYTDSNEWTDLIQISALKGEDGATPEFEVRDGHLIAKYE